MIKEYRSRLVVPFGAAQVPVEFRGRTLVCKAGVVSTEVPIIIYFRGPVRAAKAEANTIAARGYKLPRIKRDSRRD
jgi:hypothetical protein